MDQRDSSTAIMQRASWREVMKQSSLVVIASFAGAAFASGFDIADKVLKLAERSGWVQSEAFVLAINSDRSRFSDALTRNAWKRLILADLFARRVQDGISSAGIEEAWKAYIQSLIEWNADLMVYIVGLEKYYDERKSREFEMRIQNEFREVDSLVRAVYISPYVRQLQRPTADLASGLDKGPIEAVFKKTEEARETLYFFARCFHKNDQQRRSDNCSLLDDPAR